MFPHLGYQRRKEYDERLSYSSLFCCLYYPPFTLFKIYHFRIGPALNWAGVNTELHAQQLVLP